MGRYYTGDIDGKFWFGVQQSDDASFFGVEPGEPAEVEYCFQKEDLPNVRQGIETCRLKLGDRKEKVETFFKQHNGYNDKMLAAALGIDEPDIYTILGWFARLELGEKIEQCLVKNGECCFSAEL
jgi:hypothetical protein